MNDHVERTVDVATLVIVTITLIVAIIVAYKMYRNRNRDFKLVKSEERLSMLKDKTKNMQKL